MEKNNMLPKRICNIIRLSVSDCKKQNVAVTCLKQQAIAQSLLPMNTPLGETSSVKTGPNVKLLMSYLIMSFSVHFKT